MKIWHENYTLEHVIALRDNNLNKHLGIKFTEISDNSISATMPVEDFTRQSRGILHGGASCVLAEALGSIASNLCLDMRKQKAVGLELNANHIRPVRSGIVTGVTKPVALGKSIPTSITVVETKIKISLLRNLFKIMSFSSLSNAP